MVSDSAEIQPENGFVRIHPAILELLAQRQLGGREFRCLLFLFRKTYGYQKKEDKISLSQWGEGTGIPRTRVGAVLDNLINQNIIYRIDGGEKRPASWGFNKYFETWQEGQSVTLQGDSLEGQSVTLQGDSLEGQSVTLQGDSLESSVTLQGDRSVTLQGDNKRKKETYTPGTNYFGQKRPLRGEKITADGYTQDAAKEGVDAATFRGIFDALIDAAGWRRLVDAGDDTKLGYAKREALMLIRMGTRTAEQTAALVDAYRAANEWRTNPPKPSDIATYASQLADKHELPPAPTNGVVRGFSLSDMLGD